MSEGRGECSTQSKQLQTKAIFRWRAQENFMEEVALELGPERWIDSVCEFRREKQQVPMWNAARVRRRSL